ncbi:MAG: hypothetical protein NXI08_05565 [bacterium]|nr:hypothetical protein [bacterium]
MKFSRSFKSIIFVLGFAVLGLNCSDDNTSGTSSDYATISGQVESSKSKTINNQATVVSAAYITANGSVETISDTETNVDASGNFELQVDAEAYQNIIVEAKSDTETTMGFVSGSVENGSEYTIKPIDAESKAETMVFAELVANNGSNNVSKAEIEAIVTSESAANVNSSSATSIAAALKKGAEVRAAYFQSEFNSESEAKLEAMMEAMAEAQADLEAKLAASTSAESETNAYVEFEQDFFNAYLAGNTEASVAAKAAEMWSRAVINGSANASAEARASASIQSSVVLAHLLDVAVEAEARAAGASESTISAVAQASVDLRNNLKATAGTESEIRAEFQTYHDEVRTAIENDSNFNATVIAEIDTQINATSGSKTVFESALATTATADLMVDVYETFFTSIESNVSSSMQGSSDTKIEAVTELMILINAAS